VTDASSPGHTSPPKRLDTVVDEASPRFGTTSIGRHVSLRRALAATGRALVEASAYETEEGVVIARGWCFPWLCFPITPRSPGEGGTRR
jgi:hypothetical protein